MRSSASRSTSTSAVQIKRSSFPRRASTDFFIKFRLRETHTYEIIENVNTYFLEFDDERSGGFASCEIGNKLTEEERWAKLRFVKEVAGTLIVSDHNTYQKNRQGHAMCPCFLEVGNRLFHFRRQAIIYLWLLCLIFLSVYLTDFELYLEKGEEGTWRHC